MCGHESWSGPEPRPGGLSEMPGQGRDRGDQGDWPEQEEGPRPALQVALPGIYSHAEAPTSEIVCKIRFFFLTIFAKLGKERH